MYNRRLSNDVALISGNESLTGALNRAIGQIFIGCHSRIFNFYVQELLNYFLAVINKVQALARKLYCFVPSAKRCSVTSFVISLIALLDGAHAIK